MVNPSIIRHHFPIIPSTQIEAFSHLEDLSSDQWQVYTTDEQTDGQGTHEHSWLSPKGNVYASYIFLLPENAKEALPHISQIATLSIRQMVDQYQIPSTIKWINDVLIDHKKIAGVLTEVKTIQKIVPYYGVCIGIGINVNVNETDLMQIDQPATSLKTATGQTHDLDQIVDALSKNLQANIQELIKKGYSSFSDRLNAYLERFDSLPVIFDTEKPDHKYHIGAILGLDEKGALVLKTKTGEEKFISGRILHGKEIEKALTDETLQTLITTHHFDTMLSTQHHSKENTALVKDGFWHLITAKTQTGGAGSSGEWFSPQGNLYATFLLPKTERLASITQISEIVAFSVAELLKEIGLAAELKWRNDVKIGDKKISGVLVEIGDVIAVIIGIGININTDPTTITTLDQETTSIKDELTKEEDLDVEDILLKLEKKLYLNIELLKSYGFSLFLPWLNEILKYKDEEVVITSLIDGSVIKGRQKIITPSGGILIETLEGEKILMEGHLRPLLTANKAHI